MLICPLSSLGCSAHNYRQGIDNSGKSQAGTKVSDLFDSRLSRPHLVCVSGSPVLVAFASLVQLYGDLDIEAKPHFRIYAMHSLAAAATLGLFGVVTAITTPPLGAVTVGGGKGSHEYSSIQKAVDSGATSIFIYAGTYKEQVSISSTNGPLTIYGYSANDTTYTSNEVTILHSAAASGGQPSDPSATLRSHSKSFNLYNVNIVNSHGAGNRAVALSAYGDQQGYYGCQVKGYQGTLLAEANHQIFVNTYVEGAKEFVFGKRAGVWFEQCDIGVLSAKSGAITGKSASHSRNSAPLRNTSLTA